MKKLLGLCVFSFALCASASPPELKVVFSEDSSTPQARGLNERFNSLGVSPFSNFPYARKIGGHTFIYFSQLKTGVHGKGSIPVVAVRPRDSDDWSLHPLFGPDGKPSPGLLETVQRLGVTKDAPLVLRGYVLSGYPQVQVKALRPAEGELRAWGAVEYLQAESKYVRTAYDNDKSWLIETGDLSGPWQVRASRDGARCEPIARQPGLQFSEAAVAKVDASRWVALTREDSGRARKDRGLYQTESFDSGCTWSQPKRIGDGTQPNLVKIIDRSGSTRLILCVGDRTAKGTTSDIGIQCRASSSITPADPDRPVNWGAPRMVYKSTKGADLGQPSSIQIGKDTIETFFYADRGVGTKTDILAVRHRVSDLALP